MQALLIALGELVQTASNTLPQGLQGVRSSTPKRGRRRTGSTGRKAKSAPGEASSAVSARKTPARRRTIKPAG
jgi:DNA topoisomerase-3